MAKKVFVIDIAKCNGCHTCQIACKDEHVGNDWTPIAKPQPETGQFWLKLTERVRGTVPKVKVAYRPHLCMHCDKAPCMDLVRRTGGASTSGTTVWSSSTRSSAPGCRNCVDACPYDVIFFNEDLNIAQKCTGCAHLLDDGWKEPRCADACPTLAIKMMDEDEAQEYRGSRGLEAGAQGRAEAPGLLPEPARRSSSPGRSTTRWKRRSSSAPTAR